MQYAEQVKEQLCKLRYDPGYITCLREDCYVALCTDQFQVFPVFVSLQHTPMGLRFGVSEDTDCLRLREDWLRVKLIKSLYSFRVLADKILQLKNPEYDRPCILSAT